MRKIFRLNRFSVVLSGLALLVALSGTAYAAATLGSADVIDNSLRGIDIRAASVGRNDIAADSYGRSPRLWASVSSTGANQGSEGVNLTQQVANGQYQIHFSRNIVGCAVLATPVSPSPTAARFASHLVYNSTAVIVNVYDDEGTLTDTAVDVAVFC